MKVSFTNSFDKQLSTIKDKKLLEEIAACVKSVMDADSIKNVKDIIKMKGFKTAYRIKTGNYRIGLFISKHEVEFAAVLHRKEIYRKFP